jgi:hypothetical protein
MLAALLAALAAAARPTTAAALLALVGEEDVGAAAVREEGAGERGEGRCEVSHEDSLPAVIVHREFLAML